MADRGRAPFELVIDPPRGPRVTGTPPWLVTKAAARRRAPEAGGSAPARRRGGASAMDHLRRRMSRAFLQSGNAS